MTKLLGVLAFLFVGAAFADSFSSLAVPGTANIWTAEGNAPLTCCINNGADTAAVLALGFTAGSGQVLTISSATGTVGCQDVLTNGPDGGCTGFGATDISGLGTISGIQATTTMFLVGVFLADTPPLTAPPGLNYDNVSLTYSQTSYSPLIGQVFFIGDGLTGTGSGSTQQFNVPAGATNLFLGFADAPGFSGPPDDYGDNPGSLSISGSISSTTAVPEPATWSLMALGFAGVALLRRKLSA